MTSFPIYPHPHSVIPFIHHQNIHSWFTGITPYHHHFLIYLVSRFTHLGTRYPLYIILYSTSFISMTLFPLYPHSYSVIPFIPHQNIHRIHLNKSYHHHYIIDLVSRSTHLGAKYNFLIFRLSKIPIQLSNDRCSIASMHWHTYFPKSGWGKFPPSPPPPKWRPWVVLSVQLTPQQWTQTCLPITEGGLGIRTTVSLATSAFMASAVSTQGLQEQILPSAVNIPEPLTKKISVTGWQLPPQRKPLQWFTPNK